MIPVVVGLGYPWVEDSLDGIDRLAECYFLMFLAFCGGRDLIVYSKEIFEDGGVAGDVTQILVSCILAIWSEFSSGFSDNDFEDLL